MLSEFTFYKPKKVCYNFNIKSIISFSTFPLLILKSKVKTVGLTVYALLFHFSLFIYNLFTQYFPKCDILFL